MAIGGQRVVDDLDVGDVQPDRCTDTRAGDGGEIRAGGHVAQDERDGLGLHDDGVQGSGLRVDQAGYGFQNACEAARSRACQAILRLE